MSDDWQGWYANDKPSPPGSGHGAGGHGAGGPGSSGYGGERRGNAFGAGSYEPTQNVPVPPAGGRGGAPQGGWPAQPAAQSRSGRGAGPGGPGGPGNGPGGGTRPPRRGWRRWLRPKRLLLMFVALILALCLAGTFLYFNINGKLNRANVLTAYSGRPAPGAGTNWLITGSDSRGGLTRSQEAQLALGHNVAGGRSDTIMVLHMPANGTSPVLVSIPRDSYVQIPGHGWSKINAAYALGGPKLLAETVQNATGLYINHYLGIGLGGLVDAVNAVGGVHMCLPAALKDPKAGLNLRKGCQDLNGGQVLSFVRTRHFPLGDLQREQDQRLLLSALLTKMTSTGTLFNPFAIIPAANSVAGTLDVDSDVQLLDLYPVAQALRNPVSTSVPFGGFENTSAGSVVAWDKAKAKELFGDLATDKAVPKNLLTKTSLQGTAA